MKGQLGIECGISIQLGIECGNSDSLSRLLQNHKASFQSWEVAPFWSQVFPCIMWCDSSKDLSTQLLQGFTNLFLYLSFFLKLKNYPFKWRKQTWTVNMSHAICNFQRLFYCFAFSILPLSQLISWIHFGKNANK